MVEAYLFFYNMIDCKVVGTMYPSFGVGLPLLSIYYVTVGTAYVAVLTHTVRFRLLSDYVTVSTVYVALQYISHFSLVM